MIEKTIKERIEVSGSTQVRIAEIAHCTPTQLSMFLQGKGFLNQQSLEAVLSAVGMDYNIYTKRMQLAKETAKALRNKGVTDISKYDKNRLAREAGLPSIKLFYDVDEKDFDLILSSGVIDYESTFPYFKSLVMHLMQVGEKTTPKSVESSLASLIYATSKNSLTSGGVGVTLGALFPAIGAAAVIGLATAKFFENRNIQNTVNNVFAPLISVARHFANPKQTK